MWKTNVTPVFEDVDRLFEEIYIKKGLKFVKSTILNNICKKLNIYFKGKSKDELRDTVKVFYDCYLKIRRNK